MSQVVVRRSDLVEPELSYSIIGCAYDVYNELGYGHSEKYYQRAFSILFENRNIRFKEQVYYPLTFRDKIIGKIFLDFLIEEKIIVELKKDEKFTKSHIDQVLNYLKISNLRLAILINVTKNGIVYRRIVNVNEEIKTAEE